MSLFKSAKRVVTPSEKPREYATDTLNEMVVSSTDSIKLRKAAAKTVGVTEGDFLKVLIIGDLAKDAKGKETDWYETVSLVAIKKDTSGDELNKLGKKFDFHGSQTKQALMILAGKEAPVKGTAAVFTVAETALSAETLAEKAGISVKDAKEALIEVGEVFEVTFKEIAKTKEFGAKKEVAEGTVVEPTSDSEVEEEVTEDEDL